MRSHAITLLQVICILNQSLSPRQQNMIIFIKVGTIGTREVIGHTPIQVILFEHSGIPSVRERSQKRQYDSYYDQ